MTERARSELQSWGKCLVCVSSQGPVRFELIVRMIGVGRGPPGALSLEFEREGRLWCREVAQVQVTPRLVELIDRAGVRTRIARLLVPRVLEGALHVGQFATRSLGLRTVPDPFTASWAQARSRARPRTVVVWAEFAARSRLSLWWSCASFRRAAIAVVPLPRIRPAEEEVFGIRSPRELMESAQFQVLTSRQVGRFAANWENWSRGVARFRDVELEGWPEESRWAGCVPAPLWDLFPSRERRRFALARYDRELLQLLGTEWSTTLAVLRRLLASDDSRLMQVWGDLTLHQRLDAWSRWQHGRWVSRRRSQGDRAFSGLEYRLTAEGSSLLDQLPSLSCAPPLVMGAFCNYRPGSWVLTADGPRRTQTRGAPTA